MSIKSYGLFCPLAMACEIIEPRWTLLILLEMAAGATRFNDIRRGVPGISPTLLSKRFKEMERHKLIERLEDTSKGTVDYVRTPMGIELEPALRLLGKWAYQNIEAEVALDELKPDYLMWNLRRKIDTTAFPECRVVVRFHFTDLRENKATYWLIARPGMAVDLCVIDPGFDIDLFVEADSRAFASVWMGYSSWQSEISNDRVFLSGDLRLAKTIDKWLVKCSFAAVS
ncbi:MAG: helix-turn-helix domain-containing protein [Alphaproteobacteria bacterium]